MNLAMFHSQEQEFLAGARHSLEKQ